MLFRVARCASCIERHSASKTTSTDIIAKLPKHLAKRILSLLDYSKVEELRSVNKNWGLICSEVLEEKVQRQDADDYVLDLQAICDATYAQWVEHNVYGADGVLEPVRMFEQNIFCGTFSVVSFPGDVWDADRCAHYCGSNYVLSGSSNKLARLWDAKTGKIIRTLPGHAGTIQAVHLDEVHKFLLTGSNDTTVRLWNVDTGHCDATFDGCHSSKVLCLDADFISGYVN